MVAALVGIVATAAACTDKTADASKKDVNAAFDATKKDADKAIDATNKAGDKTAEAAKTTVDKTAEVAGKVADKSKDVVLATGTAVTDTWITTKLKAKFADEIVLKDSDIKVNTTDHVVTLTGIVLSGAAKSRAADIAKGTDGVTRVVNHITVK
jgi:hyperosmotically inducible protein